MEWLIQLNALAQSARPLDVAEPLSTTLLRSVSRGPQRKLRSRNRAVVVVLKTLQLCRVDAHHHVVEQT
jgi:hypothetical protein